MRHVSRTPQSCLWIGCLTGLILIPKFRIDTSTPNINSQTFWPKVILHVTEWHKSSSVVQHQPFSALFAALRIFSFDWLLHKRWRRGCKKQKEKGRIVAKSKPTAMNLTSTVSTSSSSVNHPIASKSPGILNACRGNPDVMTRRNSKPTQRRVLKEGWNMHTLAGGWWKVAEKSAVTE